MFLSLFLFPLFSFASLKFFDSDDVSLGNRVAFKCGTGLSCSVSNKQVVAVPSAAQSLTTLAVSGASTLSGNIVGDGGDAIYGFKQSQVAATATTITAAQCGKTFINAGAIEMELPEASTVLGCRLTFIVGNASNFTIDPDAADSIVLLTNAAGDSLIADAVGESLTIEAISASEWAPVGAEKGTWTDSN